MSVPYVFADLPNGTAIPLSYLDANFTYLETNPEFSGNVVIDGDLGVGSNPPNHYSEYTTVTVGGLSSATNGSYDVNYSTGDLAAELYVSKGATAADDYGLLYFSDSDGNYNFYLGYDGDNTGYGTYLYSAKNQPLTFWTNSLERMRITGAGDVGIGTTSPAYSSSYTTLTLGGDASKSGQIVFNYDDGSLCSEIYATGNGTGEDYIEWDAYNHNGDFIGGLYFYEPYSAFYSNNAPLYLEADGTNLGVGTSANTQIYLVPSTTGYIEFITNSSPKMRITASGELLIGTTTSGASKLVVNDNSIQINTAKTPATSGATGTTGQVCWDSSYIYVCVATNTWKRASIATW